MLSCNVFTNARLLTKVVVVVGRRESQVKQIFGCKVGRRDFAHGCGDRRNSFTDHFELPGQGPSVLDDPLGSLVAKLYGTLDHLLVQSCSLDE